MKKLWTVLSILAVANMLALAGLAAWLKVTDRLDIERLRSVRDVLRPTLAEEREARRLEEERLARERARAEEQARLDRPALTAEQQLAIRLASSEAETQRRRRIEREVADLKATLELERSRLEAERKAFEDLRAAAQAEARTIAELTSTEQFRKAIGVLEAMKPPEAKAALLEVMRMRSVVPGAESAEPAPQSEVVHGTGLARAVAYLDALQGRTRAKIIAEFLKDDPRLAATLLERIRTLGTADPPPPLSGRGDAPGL